MALQLENLGGFPRRRMGETGDREWVGMEPPGALGSWDCAGCSCPCVAFGHNCRLSNILLETTTLPPLSFENCRSSPKLPLYGGGNEFLQIPHSSVEGWDENSTVALCTDGQESQWLPLSRGRGRNTGVLNLAPWLRSALPTRSLRKTSGGRQKKGRQGIIFLQLRPEISNLVL